VKICIEAIDIHERSSIISNVSTRKKRVPTTVVNKFTEVSIMIGIKPLGDRVVIKKLEAEEKTQGGLILTSSAKEQPQVAEVVAVGPGTKDEVMELKVGDKVVFAKYGGTEIKYCGEEYTIMHQSEILAVVE
jgi:chaperonin GroES